MSIPKYFFNTFTDLKPFDILSNQQIVDRYTKTEELLFKTDCLHIENKGKSGPVYDPTAEVHKPIHFMFTPEGLPIESQGVKSDITSMKLFNYGKKWSHWVYLTIPKEFILKYQKHTVDNHVESLVKIFRQFMQECIDKNLSDKKCYELQLKYDEKYPEDYPLGTHRLMRPGWRFDNKVSQFISVRKSGIFFPIAYPNHEDNVILFRGTHRALVFATLGYDVPIFVQHPKLGGSRNTTFQLYTDNPAFSKKVYTFNVDLKNKELSYE